jgi:hypothetical protein
MRRSEENRIVRQLMFFLALPLVIAGFLSAPCEADWVNNQSGVPIDAITVRAAEAPYTAGAGGISAFYLCRAHHNNDLQPGFTAPGDTVCHFSYGGLELTSANFDYWTPSWVTSTGQAMPSNAISFGGETTANGSAYRYVCRAGLTPGKYGADLGGCSYPYGGVEYDSTQGFQWLVDPNNNGGQPPGSSPTDKVDNNYSFGPYQSQMVYYGDYYWPADAIVAGKDSDGSLLYMCTAYYQSGFQPGKTRQDWNACDVSWGGSEHYVTDYSVMIPNFSAPVRSLTDQVQCQGYANITPCGLNPVPTGVDSDGGVLYSCLVYDSQTGQGILGKTKAGWTSCSYALNGVENWSGAQVFYVVTDGLIYPPGYQQPPLEY